LQFVFEEWVQCNLDTKYINGPVTRSELLEGLLLLIG